jgi:hypothetical protein
MQAGQTLKETDPSKSGQAAAAAQFRRAAIAFQEAGDMVQAAAALAQAKEIESKQGTAYCPPAAPKSYWENLKDEKNKLYCEEAATNCVERGSAYYGSVCFPFRSSKKTDTPENRKICADALTKLKPLATDPASLAQQMAAVQPMCNRDGTPMSLRDMLKWKLAHPS